MMRAAADKLYRGFTLIELLVVLVIIGIAASLIGPVALSQYDRSKATAEREALLRLLDHYQFQAYSQNQAYTLTTHTNQLLIQKGQPSVDKKGLPFVDNLQQSGGEVVEFDYLSFPGQRLALNRNGFWTPANLRWQEGERELGRELNMTLIELGEEVSNATRD
ncbi:type II secretion system protein [Pseudidiomarina terrestris]|uniref:Type II secretion system protein n=1 Tax=Pseudidiomarina terrestris TaxID=2820060 RepID=A0AAW7QZJ5_9GAMM|nr:MULTISPECIES: type II secretion system protein [unclassified Pseudidiomarina]MDN7124463.1 type II secretion system protein [Pseudidiomarina sp. 1APP75-32.1]MDN7129246.1 type II secretion system protein [Pseudidiomarina sp. 1APR75-15]MDN7134488.1 type II secretion system protein [Pseudidiomarina sp. 1ASP75-5]MDN7136823.1 type II secretion system protein [Pseudidiomarina sp. 1ASP75-14]MEA3587717.1 type II secretion system protein [Pseudidiomarina sp. 1APP75-27a]